MRSKPPCMISALDISDLAALEAALQAACRLLYHDECAAWREGREGCVEQQHLREALEMMKPRRRAT